MSSKLKVSLDLFSHGWFTEIIMNLLELLKTDNEDTNESKYVLTVNITSEV